MVMTNFASLFTSCPLISVGVYVGLRVVMTNPASEAPMKMTGYSGILGSTMATTSPGSPPNLRRPLPNDRESDLASVYVKLLPLTAST